MKKSIFLVAIGLVVLMSGCYGGGGKSGWVKVDAYHSIKPNAYGLGTHMNQFGAPMAVVPTR